MEFIHVDVKRYYLFSPLNMCLIKMFVELQEQRMTYLFISSYCDKVEYIMINTKPLKRRLISCQCLKVLESNLNFYVNGCLIFIPK